GTACANYVRPQPATGHAHANNAPEADPRSTAAPAPPARTHHAPPAATRHQIRSHVRLCADQALFWAALAPVRAMPSSQGGHGAMSGDYYAVIAPARHRCPLRWLRPSYYGVICSSLV